MKFTDALRYVVLGGIFLLPFVPLIVSNNLFFPFITGKGFFFRIVVEIIFAAWILLALYDARYRPTFSGILIACGAFVAVIGVANVFGENFFRSFWSNFERMEGYVTILHLFAYFLVAGSVLATEKLWSRLAHTSVAVSVIVCLYGLVQLAGLAIIHQGGVRVDASLGNAAYLAAYMLMHVFITALLMVRSNGGAWIRVLYGVVIALQVFIVLSTATRGAVLGLLAGVLLTAVLVAVFERTNRRLRLGAIALLALVALSVGAFFTVRNTAFVQNDPILSRFSNINLEAGETRFTIWNMAWKGFLERPILGWGQESFHLIFNKYYDISLHSQEPWFDHVHNIVLDWMVAGGLLGAVAYFAIPLTVLYYLWRKRGREMFSVAERSIITGLLAAYFFQNLFVFDTIVSYLVYFSLLAYVYVRTRPALPTGRWATPLDRGMVTRLWTPAVLVGLVCVVSFLTVPGMVTAKTLIKALAAAQEDYTLSLDYFEDLAARGGLGSKEVTEQLTFVAQRALGADVPDEVKMRAFNLASQELEEHIERAPKDARLHYFYASLLSGYGRFDQAFEELETVLRLSPGKQVVLLYKATLLENLGRTEEAFELFEYTFELAPDNYDARVLYAAAAIKLGQYEKAENLLLEAVKEHPYILINDSVLNAYAEVGRYDKVLEIWKKKAQNEPNNHQVAISLAAAYLKVGDRAEAIAQIRRAMKLNPAIASQGEALIREIQSGKTF